MLSLVMLFECVFSSILSFNRSSKESSLLGTAMGCEFGECAGWLGGRHQRQLSDTVELYQSGGLQQYSGVIGHVALKHQDGECTSWRRSAGLCILFRCIDIHGVECPGNCRMDKDGGGNGLKLIYSKQAVCLSGPAKNLRRIYAMGIWCSCCDAHFCVQVTCGRRFNSCTVLIPS